MEKMKNNYKNKDIIELYKKGYSIDCIVKTYYKFKTKDDIQNYAFGNQFIITRKSITMEKAREDVEEAIINYHKHHCTKSKFCAMEYRDKCRSLYSLTTSPLLLRIKLL